MIKENKAPVRVVDLPYRSILCYDEPGDNIDLKTVNSFGEEWNSFHSFSDEDLHKIGDTYFDIVSPGMLGKDKIAADFGCGSGRWSKYLADKVGAIAAIDPSDAVIAAGKLLKDTRNVHLYKASISNLPFPDNYFDFGFSLGVLHHIPDTGKAMSDCVKKVKAGGFFLVYLYYALDNRSLLYKSVFGLSNLIRKLVSRMPSGLKKFCCNVLAVLLYMPFVLFSRLMRLIGMPKRWRARIPLHSYESVSFYIIRNDALDRFGTPLEQRFSRKEIAAMMENAGLTDIVFSESTPFWHAVGRKK
jgi:SAM-dependent methyltransferase